MVLGKICKRDCGRRQNRWCCKNVTKNCARHVYRLELISGASWPLLKAATSLALGGLQTHHDSATQETEDRRGKGGGAHCHSAFGSRWRCRHCSPCVDKLDLSSVAHNNFFTTLSMLILDPQRLQNTLFFATIAKIGDWVLQGVKNAHWEIPKATSRKRLSATSRINVIAGLQASPLLH